MVQNQEQWYVSTTYGTTWTGKVSEMLENYNYEKLFTGTEKEIFDELDKRQLTEMIENNVHYLSGFSQITFNQITFQYDNVYYSFKNGLVLIFESRTNILKIPYHSKILGEFKLI